MKILYFQVVIFLVLFFSKSTISATIKLAWDRNKEDDLLGYRIHWGMVSGKYQWQRDVGNVNQYKMRDLSEGARYYMAITAVDYWGNESGFSAEVSYLAGNESPDIESLTLSTPSPNPFLVGKWTMIHFTLPQGQIIKLSVYNCLGQKVKTMVSGRKNTGIYYLVWDGRDDTGRFVSSGVYFFYLETQTQVLTQNVALIR